MLFFFFVVILLPFFVSYYMFFDFTSFVVGFGLDTLTTLFLSILILISFSIIFFSSFYMMGDLKNS